MRIQPEATWQVVARGNPDSSKDNICRLRTMRLPLISGSTFARVINVSLQFQERGLAMFNL